MTDIASYLNLLFATIGQAHCPRTAEPTPNKTPSQILESILSLPEGTENLGPSGIGPYQAAVGKTKPSHIHYLLSDRHL